MLATSGWLSPLVELADCVNTVLPTHGLAPLPDRARRPDAVVNLHGAGPQSNALLDALQPVLRIGHSGHGWSGPEWVADQHERHRWCRMLDAHGISTDPEDFLLPRPGILSEAPGAVVVHPGAAYGSKRWPVKRFAAVGRALLTDGHDVVITGSAGERNLAMQLAELIGLPRDYVLAGRTGLLALAVLVADATLVVSGDTGIAHLAYAMRTPSVTVFGPAPARHWGPPETGPHRALSLDSARVGEQFAAHPDPALLGVNVSDVLDAAREVLTVPGVFAD
jgi:ADP-heptose:LPS heptosyltransferase